MGRVLSTVFADVADNGRRDHGSNVNWKGKAGQGQKIRHKGAKPDRNDQLEYRHRIHRGMALMLLFFFDQKAVILRNNSF